MKNYKENYLPFENRDIVKFTKEGGDPDLLLPHFIRNNKFDRATILTKLIKTIPQTQKHIPLYAYLSKSLDEGGNVDPMKLNSLYSKLGPKQRNVLIRDPQIKEQLNDYSNLVNKNREAFNLMASFITGKGETAERLSPI